MRRFLCVARSEVTEVVSDLPELGFNLLLCVSRNVPFIQRHLEAIANYLHYSHARGGRGRGRGEERGNHAHAARSIFDYVKCTLCVQLGHTSKAQQTELQWTRTNTHGRPTWPLVLLLHAHCASSWVNFRLIAKSRVESSANSWQQKQKT